MRAPGNAAKWNAPLDDVTDLHGDYEGAAARLREAIAQLERYLDHSR